MLVDRLVIRNWSWIVKLKSWVYWRIRLKWMRMRLLLRQRVILKGIFLLVWIILSLMSLIVKLIRYVWLLIKKKPYWVSDIAQTYKCQVLMVKLLSLTIVSCLDRKLCPSVDFFYETLKKKIFTKINEKLLLNVFNDFKKKKFFWLILLYWSPFDFFSLKKKKNLLNFFAFSSAKLWNQRMKIQNKFKTIVVNPLVI